VNERQAAAVNVVLGTLVVASLVGEPGPRQVLATLKSSPTLVGVGLLGAALAVVGERAARRFDWRGANALLGVALVVPVLAVGHAVSGLAGVRVAALTVVLGAVGGSTTKLLPSGGSRATAGE
jgi:hypothetical protein